MVHRSFSSRFILLPQRETLALSRSILSSIRGSGSGSGSGSGGSGMRNMNMNMNRGLSSLIITITPKGKGSPFHESLNPSKSPCSVYPVYPVYRGIKNTKNIENIIIRRYAGVSGVKVKGSPVIPEPGEELVIPGGRFQDQLQSSGYLWVDSVVPVRLGWWDFRSRLLSAPSRIESYIPPLLPDFIRVHGMIPKVKEGGVLVEYSLPEGPMTARDLEAGLYSHISKRPHRAPLNFRDTTIHLVRGKPFIEDLGYRWPSGRVSVKLSGGDSKKLEVEELYSLFRPFGKIMNIWKAGERFPAATVVYQTIDGGTGAVNCLHRMPFPNRDSNSRLFVEYRRLVTMGKFSELFSKHPRIFIPAIGLAVVGSTYLVFDPMRVFLISLRIRSTSDSFSFRNSGEWIMNSSSSFIDFMYMGVNYLGLMSDESFARRLENKMKTRRAKSRWAERAEEEQKLKRWLVGTPDRLLVLTGPPGSGKTSLVGSAVRARPNVLHIDVRTFIDRTSEEFIRELAKRINFFPGFTVLNLFSSFGDLLTPGAGKVARSDSNLQLRKIIECLSTAVGNVGSQVREDSPNDLPLIVIDGWTETVKDRHENFLELLLRAAMLLTEDGVCRVILVADGTWADQLSRQYDLKIETLALGDASLEQSIDFVRDLLPDDIPQTEIAAIHKIGGRFADLHRLRGMLVAGYNAKEAVSLLVADAVSIMWGVLFDSTGTDKSPRRWRPDQFIALIREFEKEGVHELLYDDVLFTIFKGDALALGDLQRYEVITVLLENGKPHVIQPGAPICGEAFRSLLGNKKTRVALDEIYSKATLGLIEKKLRELEAELLSLSKSIMYGGGPTSDRETKKFINERIQYLGGQIKYYGDKAEKYKNLRDEAYELRRQKGPLT